MEKRFRAIAVAKGIVVVMLLSALGKHPYGYYQILRWVVAGVTSYSAYLAYQQRQIGWAWTLSIIAMVFNPIVPVYLERATWVVVDIVAAAIVLASILRIDVASGRERDPNNTLNRE